MSPQFPRARYNVFTHCIARHCLVYRWGYQQIVCFELTRRTHCKVGLDRSGPVQGKTAIKKSVWQGEQTFPRVACLAGAVPECNCELKTDEVLEERTQGRTAAQTNRRLELCLFWPAEGVRYGSFISIRYYYIRQCILICIIYRYSILTLLVSST